MKPCANLTLLFNEHPVMERFGAAKEAGFDYVEVLFPYDVPVQDVVRELTIHDLKMVLINCPPPNYTGGEPGWAAVPGSRFQSDFKRALRYAQALKVTHLHIMAGDAEGDAARACFVDNLRWAADQAPDQSLTIEPLNPDDKPGYFLNDFGLALEVIAAVDRPNLRLQYDTYHAAKIHGDAAKVWDDVKDMVVHVQVGQAPVRTEPVGKGIDFKSLFATMKADGYNGWVSGEYHPAGRTEVGLAWLDTLTAVMD